MRGWKRSTRDNNRNVKEQVKKKKWREMCGKTVRKTNGAKGDRNKKEAKNKKR